MFGVDGFIEVRTGGRRVRSRSLGAFGCALGDVRFVLCVLVHWGEPLWSSGSLRISGFIGKRPGVRKVRLGSLGSLESALVVVGFFQVAGFIELRPWGRRGRSLSLGSFRWALGVVGFGRCRWVFRMCPG